MRFFNNSKTTVTAAGFYSIVHAIKAEVKSPLFDLVFPGLNEDLAVLDPRTVHLIRGYQDNKVFGRMFSVTSENYFEVEEKYQELYDRYLERAQILMQTMYEQMDLVRENHKWVLGANMFVVGVMPDNVESDYMRIASTYDRESPVGIISFSGKFDKVKTTNYRNLETGSVTFFGEEDTDSLPFSISAGQSRDPHRFMLFYKAKKKSIEDLQKIFSEGFYSYFRTSYLGR